MDLEHYMMLNVSTIFDLGIFSIYWIKKCSDNLSQYVLDFSGPVFEISEIAFIFGADRPGNLCTTELRIWNYTVLHIYVYITLPQHMSYMEFKMKRYIIFAVRQKWYTIENPELQLTEVMICCYVWFNFWQFTLTLTIWNRYFIMFIFKCWYSMLDYIYSCFYVNYKRMCLWDVCKLL